MQNSQKLQSLQLREQSLAEREALLDDTKRIKQLEVLDKQITVKRQLVDELAANLETLTKDRDNRVELITERIKQLTADETAKLKTLAQLDERSKRLETNVKQRKQELADVKTEITGQQLYLADQQATVDTTIADWNAQLTGFQAEADRITEAKNIFNADLVRLEQEKQAKTLEVENLQQKAVEIEAIYTDKASHYKEKLTVMKSTIAMKENEALELDLQQEAKLKVIMSREQAVTIRETALRTKELDLSNRERALNNKLNLYG